jgi:hypothetical protein
MHKIPLFAVCAVVFLAPLIGFSGVARADDGAATRSNINGGCFLLHDLLDNEASLPILLDLKTAPPEIQAFAIKISRAAKSGMRTLEVMRDHDASMNWDHNPLPKIEQDIRASITDEKEHQLLFGTKGPDFARALLVSQAEASKYAANIAKVLSAQDSNPDHRRDFKRISEQWHALNDEDFRLLRNY